MSVRVCVYIYIYMYICICMLCLFVLVLCVIEFVIELMFVFVYDCFYVCDCLRSKQQEGQYIEIEAPPKGWSFQFLPRKDAANLGTFPD